MSEKGDNRKLHREKYHEWLRRRWRQRAAQAAERRAKDQVSTKQAS